MVKRTLFLSLVTILFVTLLFSACSKEIKPQEMPTTGDLNIQSGGKVSLTVKNERLDYAKYQANLTCEQATLGVDNYFENTTLELLNPYNFSKEDLERLSTEYDKDEEFQILILSEVQQICPDYYKLVEENNN
jgi:hypothetical protein